MITQNSAFEGSLTTALHRIWRSSMPGNPLHYNTLGEAESIGYRSRHTELSPDMIFTTRPCPHLTGGLEIDIILLNSPTLQLSQYETGEARLWIRMSDQTIVLFSPLYWVFPLRCPVADPLRRLGSFQNAVTT